MRSALPISLALAALLWASCRPAPTLDQAKALARRFLIADGHVDLPYRMRVHHFRLDRQYLDVSIRTPDGDFDYERSVAGGLDAPFMSIYLPSDRQLRPGNSKALADSLIDMIAEIPQRFPDKFAMAYSPGEAEANTRAGKISLPMGMENGSGIEHDLANVAYFHRRGIRYITLTHATDNLICDSSYDTTRTWNGLSPFGDSVVREMNRIGIMVDVSHISDSAFFDVMRIVRVPVIASHSSCRAFTPGFERNMSDTMIRMVGQNGGVILINFGSAFLDGELRKNRDRFREAAERDSITPESPGFREYVRKFEQEQGKIYSHVETVADHIDHVVRLIGVEHVGFGSDFDGVGDSLPEGLKDVSYYPVLILELLKRGYSEADIERICGGNFMRVWRAVEAAGG
ncbi:MAG: dipeptidase [Bacteroidia bacterium]|nr:dipeptidase [Bacteroidia bacterium]